MGPKNVSLVDFFGTFDAENLSLKYSNLGKNWAGKNEGRRRRSVNKFFDAFDGEKLSHSQKFIRSAREKIPSKYHGLGKIGWAKM